MELQLLLSSGSSSSRSSSTNGSSSAGTSTGTSTTSTSSKELSIPSFNPFKLKPKKQHRKSIEFKGIFKSHEKKTDFKTYLEGISRNELMEFFFLERYFEYKKISNSEEKKLFESKIFKDFIYINGIYHLKNLKSDLLNKVETSYQIDSASIGLKLIYKELFDNLNIIYKQYWVLKIDGTSVNENIPPTTFEALLKKKEAKLLFSNFVNNHFGKLYIDCFNDLIEYNEKKSTELAKKLLSYCVITSENNIILNRKFRDVIVESTKFTDKFKDNWYDPLFKMVFNILANEYYPRFINSKSWKNYLNLIYSNEKKTFDDAYTIKKVVKETESFFEKIQILTVENKMTNENFTAKRIVYTATKDSNEMAFFDFVEHKNILNFIEYFTDDITNEFNKKSTTIITTEIEKSLSTLLENQSEKLPAFVNFKNELTIISQEIIGYLKQLLLALAEFHKKSIHFQFGELTEESIYLSIYNSIQVDPGIYTKNFSSQEKSLENCPVYLIPPEKKPSPKSDIFTIGMIIFRLITLMPQDETTKLFFVSNIKSPKSPFSPKSSNGVGSPPTSTLGSKSNSILSFNSQRSSSSAKLNSQNRTSIREVTSPRNSLSTSKRISSFFNSLKKSKTYDYFENIKDIFSELYNDEIYDEKLLQTVIQMIDPNPDLRPDTDELIENLSQIKLLLKQMSKKKSSKFDSLDDHLKNLIKDDEQRPYLKEFLRTEYNVETILFLEDCRCFSNLQTDQEKFDKAEEICQTYIHENSPLEINISGDTKNQLFNDFEDAKHKGEISEYLFHDMERHVIDTIMVDSLPRFEKSVIGNELFKKL